MKTMRCAPAFRYTLRDYLQGVASFYAVLVAIVAFTVIFSLRGNVNVGFSGFGIISAFSLFVFGIVTPRPDLRLCIQMGVSRRTAFIAMIASFITSALILAVAGELLVAVGSALVRGRENVTLADLYQIIYVGMDAESMSFGQHALSTLFNSALMVSAFAFGMFITLMFWRLNKMWTIVVAVGTPLLLNLLPLLLRTGDGVPYINAIVMSFLGFLEKSVWNVFLLFVLIAVFFFAVSWLLVRAANIREPKKG